MDYMDNNENIDISFISTVSLTPEERNEIMAVCCEAFGGPFEELFDLVTPTGVHVLARIDGRLVSHAVITERSFRIGALPELRAAYIDAVATLPAFRRRGYGSVVMQKAVEYASDKFGIAALSTFLDRWYEELEWERWMGKIGLNQDGVITMTEGLEEKIMIHRLPGTPRLDVHDRLIASWRPGGGW